jgi:hypothetical protein
VTFARHVADVLCLFLVLAGPLPLALVLGAAPARRSGVSHALLALLVAWTALELAVALVLGMLGCLDLGWLMTAEAALFVLGMRPLLRLDVGPTFLTPTRALSRAEWAVMVALAVLGTSLLFRFAAEPPTDHDSIGYHLTAVARWIQAGTFVRPERATKVAYYPYGWEALCALFVLPFHEDLLVALPNLIAWAILGLAIVRAGAAIGASRLHALAAAFVVLATPLVRSQVTTMHVDLPLAAFFLAGLAFALAHAATRSPVDLAMFAATLGLVAGVKMPGLVYDAMLGAAFLVLSWLGRETDASTSMLRRPWVMIGPALLIGAFWYARNFADTGNPLGLVRVALGGRTLFAGRIESATLWQTTLAGLFDVDRASHWRVLGGVVRRAMRVPGLLLGVATLALLVRPRPAGRGLAIVLLLLLGAAAVYLTTPYSAVIGPGHTQLTSWMGENLRYALPFVALLGVTASLGATRWVGAPLVIIGTVVVLLGAANPWMPAAAALLAMAGLAARTPRRNATAMVALLLAALVCGSFGLRDERELARRRLYGAVPHRVEQALPPGGAVGYVTPAHSYLLYGTHFTNRVVYVPATGDDRDVWVRGLRDRGVALVSLGPLAPWQRRAPVVAWLADPGGPFERIAGDDPARGSVLYRLR